jgi:hypothetical protein
MATLQLNYTDRMTQRFLIVNTNTSTYKIDFIQKQFWKDNVLIALPEDPQDSYLKMCHQILDGGPGELTTYQEALQLTKLMAQAVGSNENKTWCQL